MGGDAEGMFLDMVTLDTKLSCGVEEDRGKETDTSSREREREREESIILWFV